MAEREAASEAAPRFRRLEAEIHGTATKKTPGSQKPRHGHAKQGARQGGTEPGTTRFRDGRKTTRPPAPRWGPARGPRLNCGRKAPAGKARKFSAWQILRFQPRSWI